MKNLLAAVFVACLSALVSAQEIPGMRLSLSAPSIVAAQSKLSLRLLIELSEDCEVPSQLLNGANFTVRTNGEPNKPIIQKGEGAAVSMRKGTRIERMLTYPASTFMVDPDAGEIVTVAVSWSGLLGVDCTFKVAPDTKNIKLFPSPATAMVLALITRWDLQVYIMALQRRVQKPLYHPMRKLNRVLHCFSTIPKGYQIAGGNTCSDWSTQIT